ncbi:MAG TPA: cytochrome C oxidase subunit IV family protein [Flavobacteriales bacterium]|mgnify:CR=1 FL=1|jgi:cytochrome c oxidase subunit IV|nr:cytochrome C oxidase subunit IV family protein [Flavobacteriales bacterium]HPH81575.1 cytochrome C oxidase subunit IV family protein [Flavobacteriales bacterium]
MEQTVDQSFEYSAGHGPRTPEQSRAVRKKILFVTLLLSVITIFEVMVGIFYSQSHVSANTWTIIKWMYIVLTLIKAGYIVLVFMHLGDERKNLRTTILLPMVLVVYLIFIALYEGEHLLQYFQDLMK